MVTKKNQIRIFLREAKNELKKFKKIEPEYHDWDIRLSQASEKIWAAYLLMLEYVSSTEITYSNEIWGIKNNLRDRIEDIDVLHTKARLLHVYHYEGRTPNIEIYENAEICIKRIKNIMKRI